MCVHSGLHANNSIGSGLGLTPVIKLPLFFVSFVCAFEDTHNNLVLN